MFEVGVVTQFEAAHQLKGDFGPATRMHGHTYRVEISVRGDDLRRDGTLIDLNRLQIVTSRIVESLHCRHLDELPAFQGLNSTAEVVARHIHQGVSQGLRGQGLGSLSVRVWESPTAYALFERALES